MNIIEDLIKKYKISKKDTYWLREIYKENEALSKANDQMQEVLKFLVQNSSIRKGHRKEFNELAKNMEDIPWIIERRTINES